MIMNISTIALLLCLLALPSIALRAQTADTILPNPKAVLLKRIWMVRGSTGGGERVGDGAGSVHDVNNDSLSDIAVYRGRDERWGIYLGDRTTGATPSMWSFDSSSSVPAHPTVGRFFGDSQQVVGFPRYERIDSLGRTQFFLKYSFFKVDSMGLQSEPCMVFDPSATILSGGELVLSDILTSDLDLDGDDELIVAVRYTLIDTVISRTGLIWIFAGGPNFQVDSPTVILRDTEPNRIRYSLNIAQLNNDPYPDLLIAGDYEDNRANKLKFFWGKPSLQELSTTPNRSITLTDPFYPRIGNGIGLADVDADLVTDLFLPGPDGKIYLWRMGIPTKDPQTRSLRLDDAEVSWVSNGYLSPSRPGSLNDSTTSRQMIGFVGPSPLGGAMLVALSTNQQPINPTYEAFYGGAYDGLGPYNVFSNNDGPAGDVNGDGWCDYLTAQPKWPASDAGIAMILAGGPYIPRDDATTSVHDLPAEGKRDALAVWPNPVSEVLNIAWRGDLQRMPRRFVIHRINGERVAGGVVEPSVGAAIWHYETVASGSYLLTAYDAKNQVIATTTFIKQ